MENLTAYFKEYYLKNKDALAEKQKRYREKNKDKLREKSREYYRKNKIEVRAKQKEARRKHTLKKYDLSEEQYNVLLENQNYLCAICGRPEVKVCSKGNIKSLAVDHCHTTGIVRGLLCSNCNVGLGNFEDNNLYLSSAISYLEKYKSGISIK